MKIDRQTIDAVRPPVQQPQQVTDDAEYHGAAGQQHYRLLTWFSSQFDGAELFDIGTHQGASAYCLASNPSNTVHSFDIQSTSLVLRAPNCEYHLENLWDPAIRERWRERLLASPLIFLDIDPHKGEMEEEFCGWLRENGYYGILVLDDIWYFPDMQKMWGRLDLPKLDVTYLGHWSGTGIVDYGVLHAGGANIELTDQKPTHDWTLVTAYFDLTAQPDASDAIRQRPLSFYLSHAGATLRVPQNLVIFCDTATRKILEGMRPVHLLASATRFIECCFEDFGLVQECREKIAENRKKHPYAFDPRNTPSYYLLCMLRYVLLKETMDMDPFHSTHFCWINLCMEKMGWKNMAMLEPALSAHRDRFSCCWIDYISKDQVSDLHEYFAYGRCGMCSGFFTGSKVGMTAFCDRILQVFHECLDAGYGHADEQLYSIVYHRWPSLFDPYPGDYADMITNYLGPCDHTSEPVKNLITRSYMAKDYKVCAWACRMVWPYRANVSPPWLLSHLLQCFCDAAVKSKDATGMALLGCDSIIAPQ